MSTIQELHAALRDAHETHVKLISAFDAAKATGGTAAIREAYRVMTESATKCLDIAAELEDRVATYSAEISREYATQMQAATTTSRALHERRQELEAELFRVKN